MILYTRRGGFMAKGKPFLLNENDKPFQCPIEGIQQELCQGGYLGKISLGKVERHLISIINLCIH